MTSKTQEFAESGLQKRVIPLLEVVLVFGLLEGALWSRAASQLTWAIVTLGCVVVLTWRSGRSVSELGVGSSGLRRSLWIVPAAMTVCAALLAGAWASGSLHGLSGARAPLWHALLYAVWALVQEFLTMSFMFLRIEEVLGTRTAIVLTSLLFCIAHVPNLLLMTATAVMSGMFCVLFSRYRNIYPLAISHALFGLTLSITLPPTLTHLMKVGIAYF